MHKLNNFKKAKLRFCKCLFGLRVPSPREGSSRPLARQAGTGTEGASKQARTKQAINQLRALPVGAIIIHKIHYQNTSGRAPSQARECSQHSLPGHLPNRPWQAKQAITHTIHYKSSLQERLRKISARCPPQKNHLLTKSPPFSKVRHMCMSQASWFC